MKRIITIALLCLSFVCSIAAGELQYKDKLLPILVSKIDGILKNYDPETGRFGKGIWIVQDQHSMLPLAVVYATPGEGNNYYKDKSLLEIIMKSGDALIADMDKRGQWEFRKKDASTWGPIWMPWTYSRWIRSYALIKDDMPPERREKWVAALTLGYSGIRTHELNRVLNIPGHHAMGLYIAGKVLNHPEWCKDAADFLMKLVAEQSEAGYWTEHVGPVVHYNFVYVDLLGNYYAESGDKRVLPALERASIFHRNFTYPGGEDIETIDERNTYQGTVSEGNTGFTFTPAGRAYLKSKWERKGMDKLNPDFLASLIMYGEEGETEDFSVSEQQPLYTLTEQGVDKAGILRDGQWFICLSAYTAPLIQNRWIQDRQNFASIYHEKTGLILGGGNTKVQPLWSNFTVGDVSLLQHKTGDIDPDFFPKGELYHVPTTATLVRSPHAGLDLLYGKETCKIRIKPENNKRLIYTLESTTVSGLPVAAHITLMPHIDKPLETGAGEKIKLDENTITLDYSRIGGSISHAGYIIHLPETATVHWPAMQHNPYAKDGKSTIQIARIVIRLPFNAEHRTYDIPIEIIE